MSIFKAKKVIPEDELDVESVGVFIVPPKGEKPAYINFQINGVDPIDLTDNEWEKFQKDFVKMAEKAPNLKDIEEKQKKG